MSSFNAIERLQQHGLLEGLGAEQQAVLGSLSPAEVDVLVSVKNRIDASGGDVQAHISKEGGTFW